MTGVADLYLYLKRPYSRDRRKRLWAHFYNAETETTTRFVILGWKRTGSNWLCGILHHHPEICMHNELFNPIDIFTYHPKVLTDTDAASSWTVLTRDLFPVDFLRFIWDRETIQSIRPNAKAVGFKSFPEHWTDAHTEDVWNEHLMRDLRVRKVVLHRQDELAVYVSMQRADQTGLYMTHAYPEDLKIRVDPAAFQAFVNNYRHTFQVKYKSPLFGRDTFCISYEEMLDADNFHTNLLPKLFAFLRVDPSVAPRTLRETVPQAPPDEDLSKVISNYDELEQCFRHSDVLHFQRRREAKSVPPAFPPTSDGKDAKSGSRLRLPLPLDNDVLSTWSILLPICSRIRMSQKPSRHSVNGGSEGGDTTTNSGSNFNSNRFLEVAISSQHNGPCMPENQCWQMLQRFAETLHATSNRRQLLKTQCIVGIDVDDKIYANEEARQKIIRLMGPCSVVFVDIHPPMYGHVCKIWNHLGRAAKNDYIVLLGDDVQMLDDNWQSNVAQRFHTIASREGLPLGAACVAFNDESFPGFSTFPVVHRWHVEQFGSLLPKQFSNQGGDPYLYELYSRFDAAEFCLDCRMTNTMGGDGDARYKKHQIHWRSQILNMGLRRLKETFHQSKRSGTRLQTSDGYRGIVLDVVIPSYRVNNEAYLERLVSMRATVRMYVKFWIVVDNPLESHVAAVKRMADRLNKAQLQLEGNYYINVIHYGENRGASYARNTGFNYSTADWVLFLDDDVIPDQNLLDAYAGAIRRYPHAKVLVGMTELPDSCGLWTEMSRACNVGYFYSIAKRMVHPSWGVTANLMVRGSRYNPTIQFKDCYPKTGGGEDIDLVWQFKEWYKQLGRIVTVGVPEAKVQHPWWNGGNQCYKQICGWAWGDSLCITEWRQKTFWAFPNWIEHTAFVIAPLSIVSGNLVAGLAAGVGVVLTEHLLKCLHYFSDARKVTGGASGILRHAFVALGAGSVLSSQEVTRVVALIRRGSLDSICRRVDWFDGQEDRIRLDIQLTSFLRFGLNVGLTGLAFGWWGWGWGFAGWSQEHLRTGHIRR